MGQNLGLFVLDTLVRHGDGHVLLQGFGRLHISSFALLLYIFQLSELGGQALEELGLGDGGLLDLDNLLLDVFELLLHSAPSEPRYRDVLGSAFHFIREDLHLPFVVL